MCFIKCVMSPGGFSGEISFAIELDSSKHAGTAPRRYFWDKDSNPLGKKVVKEGDRGFIFARILEEYDDGHVLLSIPDGEVVKVKKTQIVRSEPAQDVPIRSRS